MDKRDYFVLGIQKQLYRQKSWVMRLFALVRETVKEEQVADWMIYQSSAGFHFKNPESNTLEDLKPFVAGKPLFEDKEKIVIKKGELSFITQDTETDPARILLHAILIEYSFGNKVPFVNGPIDLGKLEDEFIAKKLQTTPESDEERTPDAIYPDELLRYYEAVAYLRGLALLFVPAATPKTMTVDPAVIKRRDEIFNDPSIDLNDRAVAAQVEKELTDLDKSTFEGDNGARFLISKKDFKVIRKKRFIANGSESGLSAGEITPYVKRSLNEGIDPEQFPAYNNGMRAGSAKRSSETQIGGKYFKWLVRQSLNMKVVADDCGTKVTLPDVILPGQERLFLGLNIVDGGKVIPLDENTIGSYLGKVIMRRSTLTCKNKAPDYCAVCLGQKLSATPTALASAYSQLGNDIMLESMGAMHGKSLEITAFNLVEQAR